MADHDQEQMSNATVAFMQAVAFAVAVHDTTMRGEMSAEEFLETVDQALEIRLKQPDGVELAVLLLRLRDNFRKMVSKTKVLLEDKGSAKKRGAFKQRKGECLPVQAHLQDAIQPRQRRGCRYQHPHKSATAPAFWHSPTRAC